LRTLGYIIFLSHYPASQATTRKPSPNPKHTHSTRLNGPRNLSKVPSQHNLKKSSNPLLILLTQSGQDIIHGNKVTHLEEFQGGSTRQVFSFEEQSARHPPTSPPPSPSQQLKSLQAQSLAKVRDELRWGFKPIITVFMFLFRVASLYWLQ